MGVLLFLVLAGGYGSLCCALGTDSVVLLQLAANCRAGRRIQGAADDRPERPAARSRDPVAEQTPDCPSCNRADRLRIAARRTPEDTTQKPAATTTALSIVDTQRRAV